MGGGRDSFIVSSNPPLTEGRTQKSVTYATVSERRGNNDRKPR